MSFVQGLLTARAHLAFLLGLGAALLVAWRVSPSSITRAAASPTLEVELRVAEGPVPKLRATRKALSEEERQWAKTAWRYFENNYQPTTGLVNSVNNFPSTTLWDLAAYMMALMAAEEFELIDQATFDERVDLLLSSLEKLELVGGVAPNKAYNTKTLQMVDYNNKPAPLGLGWSTLDIARIGVPVTRLVWGHPEYTERLRALLGRWNLDSVVSRGELIGSHRGKDGKLKFHQEGRFGYEQYAAKSLQLLGLDVSRSVRYDNHVAIAMVSGQPIAYDSRLPAKHDGTQNAVLSEPYILEAIEFGLTNTTLPLARALFAAQRARYHKTGTLTAVSEDNIDRPPYFVYGSILNDMKPWSTSAFDGRAADDARSVSLKAAMGWAYVFADDYSTLLRTRMADTFDPAKGWYSGKYEATGKVNTAVTANTNGIMMEILLYRKEGPLLREISRHRASEK
ncbi:MAG: hypothetical protein RLZZ450_4843 [Pseudomonadota bacterium]|jgi:hypothetical protein